MYNSITNNNFCNFDEISRFLRFFPNKVELRVLPAANNSKIYTGFFIDGAVLAGAIESVDDYNPKGFYITINEPMKHCGPINALHTKQCTKGADIKHRTNLYFDFDSDRAPGFAKSMATEEEITQTKTQKDEFLEYVKEFGFINPLEVFSGNGFQVHFKIDLENSDAITAKLKMLFTLLKEKFNFFDSSVFDANRIGRVAGTMNRKDIDDVHNGREWRMARITSFPDVMSIVNEKCIDNLLTDLGGNTASIPNILSTNQQDVLHLFGGQPTPPKQINYDKGPWTIASVQELLKKYNMPFSVFTTQQNRDMWVITCPNKNAHTNNEEKAVVTLTNGWVGFKCLHNHCSDLHAKDIFPELAAKQKEMLKQGKLSFEDYAEDYISYMEQNQNFPLYHNGINYTYRTNRYVKDANPSGALRNYLREKTIKQNNNIIANVVPIINIMIEQYEDKKDGRIGSLPFWMGDNKPFAKDADVIPFKNGIYDPKNDTLLKHSKDWLSTFVLAFDYNKDATCPQWLKFLDEIYEGAADKIYLLQQYMGYCLSKDVKYQKALVLVGKSRSGKGTIAKVLESLIGEENTTGFSLNDLDNQFGLGKLLNKQLAVIGEIQIGKKSDIQAIIERLKSIVGDDTVSIDIKHEDSISVKLKAKFLFQTNTMPNLKDSSGAVAQRLLFISHTKSFEKNNDPNLINKLLVELPGIANWAIDGLKQLTQQNEFIEGINHDATIAGFERSSCPVKSFVCEKCVVHNSLNAGDIPDKNLTNELVWIEKDQLYLSYCHWVSENEIETIPNTTFFFKQLYDLFPKMGRDTRKVLIKGAGQKRVCNEIAIKNQS